MDIDRAKLAAGPVRAVVVNAASRIRAPVRAGVADGQRVTECAGSRLGLPASEVLICSTGVIGHFLPMEKMEAGVATVVVSPDGGLDFARAIMTTDTRPKHAAVRFGPYTLGGCTKGSGMIHPNMATMLAFLTTDAPVEPAFLQSVLSDVVGRSFNLLSIDGDTSPSDTVLLFANGAGGGELITNGSPPASDFATALETLCIFLAKEMARDGEGATKLVEFRVSGAATLTEARTVVRLLTTSYLLKSAIHGADPNWGRIVAVVGRSGVTVSEAAVSVAICGTRVFECEQPTAFDPAEVASAMRGDTVVIDIDLVRARPRQRVGAATFPLSTCR